MNDESARLNPELPVRQQESRLIFGNGHLQLELHTLVSEFPAERPVCGSWRALAGSFHEQ
jgi:hypothetical protein